MTQFERRSIPRPDLNAWWEVGWAYVMPDFSAPGNYIVEWRSDTPAKEPEEATND